MLLATATEPNEPIRCVAIVYDFEIPRPNRTAGRCRSHPRSRNFQITDTNFLCGRDRSDQGKSEDDKDFTQSHILGLPSTIRR